ncbi:MAG: hypothetical protein MSC31_06780 [Solirubrobacteraceae bacterium MAG38_C4-C5]|nr:hypothetical protein [Candidatus Siliceabacter maunaloa]
MARLAERKADYLQHLQHAARPDVVHLRPAGLAGVRLRHRALPQRDLVDVRPEHLAEDGGT